MGEEIDAMLITAVMGEEIQMVDTYSQVAELTSDERVKKTLELLVKESREHAATVSDFLLDLSSKYSWELKEVDRRIAEQLAKNPEFKITEDALGWYRQKLKDLDGEGERHDAGSVIVALESFTLAEKKAHALYKALAKRAKSDVSRGILERIMGDEMRHYEMLSNLVADLKKESPVIFSEDEGGIWNCDACARIYYRDEGKCPHCKNEMERV